MDNLECDLLVVGGGMAGLSAAGWAAERGAKVVVIERGAAIGGSAVLSAGMVWTASSPGRMALYGGGNMALGTAILETYPRALEWLRRRGVSLSDVLSVLHGRGYQVDIIEHLQGCARLVEQHGGAVALETEVVTLKRDDAGAVVGALTRHADGDIHIRASATLLASGGFQASSEMRARYIHPNARNMLLRSNPRSDGAGIRLGQAVGAAVDSANPGFYGHLVSESSEWGLERHFTGLSQYHSDHCLLINEAGQRFCDESLGDHVSTNSIVGQPGSRAICFWDDRVHKTYAVKAVVEALPPIDKMQVALEYGGKGIIATSIDDIAAFANGQGFDGAAVARTIEDFNERAHHSWETINPPRAEICLPFDKTPYYALVVHPAITFTYGGLVIDRDTRVLDGVGKPISGLFAAGGDAGGVYTSGYCGGLSMAMTLGIRAAMSAGWR